MKAKSLSLAAVSAMAVTVAGVTYSSLDNNQVANAQPRERPDLNGQIVKQPETGRSFWIDQGRRRWIDGGVSSTVYPRLFIPRNDFPVVIDSQQIPLGPILSGNNRLVKCSEQGHILNRRVYFLDQGTKRHISSPEAITRNSFNRDRIEPISCPAVASIPNGPTIN